YKPTFGAINRGGSYDYLSQSSTGTIAATLAEAWQLAYETAFRVGGDPGFIGLTGPATAPAAAKPRNLAFLETVGWKSASAGAKRAIEDALKRFSAAGIMVLTRQSDARVAKVEDAIAEARERSLAINAWESRWPLNAYRDRDATKLSRHS